MASNRAVQTLIACCAGLLMMGVASAQTKVGIVNLQKAILDTAEIKKAQADMEAKYQPRQAEMAKTQKDLQDIQVQLQSGKLSPDGQQDLQAKGANLQRHLQRMQEDLQADVERDRTDILKQAGQRMTEIVKQIADAKGLDVVIDVTNTVYFKPALDITAEASAAYDKAYPVK
jgi:outer membrane protein